jgi:hypothetical protein
MPQTSCRVDAYLIEGQVCALVHLTENLNGRPQGLKP